MVSFRTSLTIEFFLPKKILNNLTFVTDGPIMHENVALINKYMQL